jgi:iron complex transport system permease protein
MKTSEEQGRVLPIVLLVCLLIAAFFLSCFLGRYSLTPRDLLFLFREGLTGVPSGLSASASKVFFRIRLPRILAAAITGCGLALSGSVYQGAFRNPLVSPDILGATAGAGLGAAVALLLNLNGSLVQLVAFLFGLAAVGGTSILARSFGDRNSMTLSLVLTGIVVSALFQAGISLVKYVGDPYTKLPAITFWLMGSLSAAVPSSLPLLAVPLLAGGLPLLLLRWKLNLLSLPDEEAMSLGINTTRLRFIVILCATLITSSVVAVGGIIGWVGLIIPHLARMLVGSDCRFQLPAAMVLGASYLLLVDDIARSATAMDIPLGILTAVIGAPFFLLLMYKQRRSQS